MLPPIGMRSLESPCAHHIADTIFRHQDTAMAEDIEKGSRASAERATEITEIVIFWCVVIGIAVIVIGLMKGVFG